MHFPAPPAPIIVQMGDDTIDALSCPSYAPLSYRWGMIVVQMGDASATLGEHTTKREQRLSYSVL